MSHPIVRFAPSPTGAIHVGNARTALLNYLFAKKHHGEFILRFDDTDAERSKEEYALAIEVDLAWLGVVPDLILRQSRRVALYDAAAAKLRAANRLYPCYETAEELERRRRLQLARGRPPVYDRAALALTPQDRAKLEAEGRRPHWRFLLERRTVRWSDLIRGDSHIEAASLSDPVLIRADGAYLYTLPSTVDDLDRRVTHVIRGEDHVANTAVQIELFEALAGEGAAPVFGHHNLLSSASGEGLSKRGGAGKVGALRDAGIESLAVAAAAVQIGSSVALHPAFSLKQLVGEFDLATLSRSQTRFDPDELATLSARTLHGLDFESVRDRLAVHDVVGAKAEPFWLAVRGNLETFLDVVDWRRVVEGEIEPAPQPGEEAFLQEAAQALPEEPFDERTWGEWTGQVRARTGRRGRALFHPLRVALTGRDTGPELAALLPLIGRLKASARLRGRAA
ncbi:glutamate--tRNA ligase [Methylocella sp.]|uniref:glutamate--tRNA ligase n=1 Tax=Methylocella sp. TaxID=1978226 RepID=UPI003782E10A